MDSIERTESTTIARPAATRATIEESVGRNIVTAKRMSAIGTRSAPSPKPRRRPSATARVRIASLVETSAAIIATATTMMMTPTRSFAIPEEAPAEAGPLCELLFCCAFELRFAGMRG